MGIDGFAFASDPGWVAIRVLLLGELIDGWVQPNGGWRHMWVPPGVDPWDEIRKNVKDLRRYVRYEVIPKEHQDKGYGYCPERSGRKDA